ncbi:MAG: tryptophan synthase subunit alpha [Candidatus Omnitrophota bacterium]|jgi:tryptophan synthase alpha chain
MRVKVNRIDARFRRLKKENKKAFIAFITAGYPSLRVTEELVMSMAAAGADIVELGVPFSDPMADGPVIQCSSQQALRNGVTLKRIIALVKRLRGRTEIPLCLMTYYNPVLSYGERRFAVEASAAGVDGIIVPDLPPEEAEGLRSECAKRGVHTIFFVSPTTTRERMKKVAALSGGFIYYLSVTGVTGARAELPEDAGRQIRLLRGFTSKPVCMGFGISTPGQVRSVCRVADGAIVGSAIVRQVSKCREKKGYNIAREIGRFVSALVEGAHV